MSTTTGYRSYDVWPYEDGTADVLTGRARHIHHFRTRVRKYWLVRLTQLLNRALIAGDSYASVWPGGWHVTVRPSLQAGTNT